MPTLKKDGSSSKIFTFSFILFYMLVTTQEELCSEFIKKNYRNIISSFLLSGIGCQIIPIKDNLKKVCVTSILGILPWIFKIQKVQEIYKLTRSVLGFHIISWIHSKKFGKSLIFHEILGGNAIKKSVHKKSFFIDRDKYGNITQINDGKKIPIILGSIPRTRSHIEELRAKYNLKNSDTIAIHSFNREFERNWSGLSNLLEKDDKLIAYLYPTTDYLAPSLIDILRLIRDLENRDLRKDAISYVQCKVGHGRSRVAIAAYIIHIAKKAKIDVQIDQVEYYLNLTQPQVHFHEIHLERLKEFKEKLNEFGNFEKMHEFYKQKIEERDLQMNKQNKYPIDKLNFL